LNIAGLSQQFQYANTASPTTLASSGAPFTDSLSSYNFDNEYFPFDHTSFPSAVPSDVNTNQNEPPLAPPFQFGTRQPASQPSSPARNVYPPGQNPYNYQPGRQRSTTFSGGYQYSDFGGQLANPPSALPSHLSFSQLRNPAVDSPLSSSPIVSNNGFLTEPVNPDTLMEDVATPLANQQNLQALGVEQLPEHMVSSLNIIDQLENRIRDIKQATLQDLTGNNQASVQATLSQLNHDVELAVPPSMAASNTPSSQGVSPAPYQSSPSIAVAPPQASPYQSVPMVPSPYQSIAPPQPQQPVYQPARSLAQINTNAMPPPQQIQISPVKSHAPQQSLLPSLPVENKRPPPLEMNGLQGLQVPISFEPPPMVHSHSFPNGHQLPSQIHAPNTPVSASPSFVNALGVPHAPVISSPLAAMPVSRPPSPPRPFPLPDQAPLPIVHSESDLKLDSRADSSKRPSANRTRSTSVHRSKAFNGMMASTSAPAPVMQSNPPSAWHSRANSPEDEEDEVSDDNGARRSKRRRSSTDVADMSSVEISPQIRLYLDEIFREFLNKVCSDRKSSSFLFTLCSINSLTNS
jgi:hypothetical protein